MNMNRLVKLCVVDDIRSVVDMITKKIPWHEHGIEPIDGAYPMAWDSGRFPYRVKDDALVPLLLSPDVQLVGGMMKNQDRLALASARIPLFPSSDRGTHALPSQRPDIFPACDSKATRDMDRPFPHDMISGHQLVASSMSNLV